MHNLSREAILAAQLAAGWEPDTAEVRADEYMRIQKRFREAIADMNDMTEQDDFRLQISEKEDE